MGLTLLGCRDLTVVFGANVYIVELYIAYQAVALTV